MAFAAIFIKKEIETNDDYEPNLPTPPVVKEEEDWEVVEVKVETECVPSDSEDGGCSPDFALECEELVSQEDLAPVSFLELCLDRSPEQSSEPEAGITVGKISPSRAGRLRGQSMEIKSSTHSNEKDKMTVSSRRRKQSLNVRTESLNEPNQSFIDEIEETDTSQAPILKRFACSKCSARYKFKSHLFRHMLVHKNGQYPCYRCPEQFELRRELDEHLLLHYKKQEFRCDICGAQFIGKLNFKQHLATHFMKPFRCRLCPARYGTDDDLQQHMIAHAGLPLEVAQHILQEDVVQRVSQEEVTQQILQEATPEDFPEQCPSSFLEIVLKTEEGITDGRISPSRNDSLKNEPIEVEIGDRIKNSTLSNVKGEITVSNRKRKQSFNIRSGEVEVGVAPSTNDKPFTCKKCCSWFKSKNELTKHKVIHQKPFSCDMCSRRFTSLKRLTLHLNAHAKSFPCNKCSATFVTRTLFQRHLATFKHFCCAHCSARFKMKSQLRIHLSVHSDEKLFCNECPAEFKSKRGYEEHLLSHLSIKPFICDVCLTEFVSNERLKSHLKKHCDDGIFSCDNCSANFKKKGDLKRHLITHVNKCPQCSQQFTRKTYLKKHVCSIPS